MDYESEFPELGRLARLGRLAAIGALAGILAGGLVAGIGGRIVMRVSALLGGDSIRGQVTDAGNVVGEITLGGTFELVIFSGMLPGILLGLLYVIVAPWLPGRTPLRGVIYGALLLLMFGSTIIDPGNSDFRRLGPPLINVVMFAALPLLFGLSLVPMVDRLGARLPAVAPAYSLAIALFVLLPLFAVGGLGGTELSRQIPSITFLVLFGGGLGTMLAGGFRSRFARTAGHAALILLALPGAAFTVRSVALILRDVGPVP